MRAIAGSVREVPEKREDVRVMSEARAGESGRPGRGRRRLPRDPKRWARRMAGELRSRTLRAAQGSKPWARRHRWFLAVLALGTVLRALAMLGYRPALWFPDSYTYIVTVFRPRPDLVRPAGYSMFLKLLEPLHAFGAVTAAQHLLGLATGVLVYRAARRAPRWVATLATVPVLLDAYQVELEHLLVSDTLFMFLVVAAVVLCQARRPATVVAIGLLLAAATLTRTVGQPLIVVLAGWFVLRGRIRPAGVLLAAALVPIVAYGAWFYATYQRVGIVGANGVFLYARTMSFADCAEMDPPPDLKILCDPRPPERRPPSQEYIWAKDSPLVLRPGITFSKENDDLAARFATLAITSQPLDYAASVLTELGRTFTWGRPVYPDPEVYAYYQFPVTEPGPPGRYPAQVGAEYAKLYEQGAIGTEIVEPQAGWLRAYQGMARLPGPVLLGILLVPPVAAFARRRGGRRLAAGPEWLVPWSAAVVLLITPAAAAEFDYRYVLPAVPLACLAAALSIRPDVREQSGGRKEFGDDIPPNVRL
ncbi:ArnT family glycosyltransferase [Nonomuraea sp. KM90]|uniref:ArnT family glycosyltransferase n=1 Tax=Nonomuraea sp. KM90 TaxID=3457428 RepID=UPI003FCCB7D8